MTFSHTVDSKLIKRQFNKGKAKKREMNRNKCNNYTNRYKLNLKEGKSLISVVMNKRE